MPVPQFCAVITSLWNKMPPINKSKQAKNDESSDDDMVSDEEPPPLAEAGTPPGMMQPGSKWRSPQNFIFLINKFISLQ